ncbi:putative immunoglobulin-blocking virulence protein [Mycoplasmopsis alligatoris]|uniref:Membrane family protein n=1 Tax=Mycoplasmopsis alligatoris A21JP2 TaxID=747682 RepID=D4XV43_9BACT|nr:putative immunoglobulin-blocking virulence protein [Mycoplasmopsis alligatoris]EFF41779.1 membrane family protein [Mycoplasmopsis alligatoris A21JP2]
MIKAKKKKILIVSAIAAGAILVPQAILVPVYVNHVNQKNIIVDIKHRSPSKAIINNALGIDPLKASNADNNLEEIKKENPAPVIKPVEPKPKPEPQPEPVDTTPVEPPKEEVKPEENPNPGNDSKTKDGDGTLIVDAETTVTIKGPGGETSTFPIKLKHKVADPRHKFPASDNDIINRIPYINNDAPEVVELTVTEELKNAVAKPVKEYLKNVLFAAGHELWRNKSGKDIKDIDLDNIKLSASAIEMLKKGLVLDYANATINENGELDSFAYSPVNDTYNGTTGRMTRDNTHRRLFGYKTWYVRSPKAIEDGAYDGWTKEDVKKDWTAEFGLSEDDGIEVNKYTNPDPTFTKGNNAIRVVLDAANPKGYAKFLKFIKDTQAKGKVIKSYVFRNMGKNDQNQKFKDILAALPNEIPQLELWFESNNTGAMIALRNKKIDELATYTKGNSLVDEWAINPWSVNGVAYIQDVDYNVSFGYGPNVKPATRITWNALSFDPENFDKNAVDPWHDINRGIRMALVVRNNEPIFQGGFGPGLKPDNHEAGNSYPVGLDVSRIPDIRSLKGFDYSPKGADGNPIPRKLRRLVLYSDTSAYTLSAQEMNESQYHKIMFLDEPENSHEVRLRFNGSQVKDMHLTGNATLDAEGLNNLQTFWKQVGKKVFNEGKKSKIFVDPSNTKLYDQLKSSGYPVEYFSEDNTLKFN